MSPLLSAAFQSPARQSARQGCVVALPYCLLGCVLMLLGGCMTQSRIQGDSRVRDAGQLSHWTASGRIGVSGVEQSGSGSFNWAQQAAASTVQVHGPLGVGALQIDFDGSQLHLRASDGTQYDADQALSELEIRLGAALPVTQLRYWLIGLAAPGAHHWSDDHQLLEQAGWRVAYSDWLQRHELQLPGRLVLTRESLRIVVVVQRWQVNS